MLKKHFTVEIKVIEIDENHAEITEKYDSANLQQRFINNEENR